jgi:hypothetical protein
MDVSQVRGQIARKLNEMRTLARQGRCADADDARWAAVQDAKKHGVHLSPATRTRLFGVITRCTIARSKVRREYRH